MSAEPLRIEKLATAHRVDGFDCGEEALNRFLTRHALAAQRSNSTQTYVACRGGRVVGYYSLAVASAEHEETTARVRKGQARHRIPIMLLARLAVDRREQGKGLGRGLLKDALLRTANAADIAGIRALVVHAKNERARLWYQGFDFEPSPTDPLHLFLLMKDLRAML